MKKSEFHLRKEMLKTEIDFQEKILEDKFETAVNPQNLIMKVLPDTLSQFINFKTKDFVSSFSENLNKMVLNVLQETQNIVTGVIQIVGLFQEVKSVFKNKNGTKSNQ